MVKKQKKQTDSQDKRVKVSTLFYALAILVVALAIVASILAYGTKTAVGERISSVVSKVVPFPAAIVGWNHILFMTEVQENLSSVEKFYRSQNFASEGLRVDFTTENGRKRLMIKEREVMDKMVEDMIIEILAKDRGIFISEKDVDKAVSQKLNEFGTENDVKKDLLDSYGWSMDDFRKKIVLPSMYSDALEKKVLAEEFDVSAPKEKIKQAKTQLESGKDFAEVVRMSSEGTSKENGGELGWVKKDQVVLELQDALFGEKPLEKNSIIESSIGFHIVEIENRKKEGDQTVLQLRQVFVAKKTFADWLIEQKKKMNVLVPVSAFIWDSKVGTIDFADESMRIFEKEERSKAQGDASIML